MEIKVSSQYAPILEEAIKNGYATIDNPLQRAFLARLSNVSGVFDYERGHRVQTPTSPATLKLKTGARVTCRTSKYIIIETF